MKRLLYSGLALLVLCGAVSAQAPDLSKMDIVMKSVPDGPVAKIGDHIIDRNEFIRFYEGELRRVMMEKKTNDVPDGARAELALRCVGLMIERQLLYGEAIRRKVTVPAENIEKAWQAQLADSQTRMKTKDGKSVTEGDLLKLLGYTKREEVLADLEHLMVTEKMRGIVLRESNITVTDEDVQKVYAANKTDFGAPAKMHLQHIYIDPKKVPGNIADKDTRAKQKAEQAIDRLAAGQSFEGVARAVSDAPDAKTGGDMGMLAIHDLPPFMVEVAGKLKPGQVSAVFKSDLGFHVIKLVDMAGAHDPTKEEATPEIRQRILATRGIEAVHAFCEKLIKDGSEVQVFLELQKNLALNGAPANAGR